MVQIGGHIKFAPDGPWAEFGPPTITRPLLLLGSCGAINSRGGGWLPCPGRLGGALAQGCLADCG